MKDKIENRLQELSQELEALMTEREERLKELRSIDIRIKELSSILLELKKLLD